MRSLSSHAAQPLSSQTSLVHLLDTQTFCRPTSRSIVLYSIYILSHAVARSLSTLPRTSSPSPYTDIQRLAISLFVLSLHLASWSREGFVQYYSRTPSQRHSHHPCCVCIDLLPPSYHCLCSIWFMYSRTCFRLYQPSTVNQYTHCCLPSITSLRALDRVCARTASHRCDF